MTSRMTIDIQDDTYIETSASCMHESSTCMRGVALCVCTLCWNVHTFCLCVLALHRCDRHCIADSLYWKLDMLGAIYRYYSRSCLHFFFIFPVRVSKYEFGCENHRQGRYRRNNTCKFGVSANRIQWKTSRTSTRPTNQKNSFNFIWLTRAILGLGAINITWKLFSTYKNGKLSKNHWNQ